ncbi:MAG: hypothetical protein ACLUW6_04840 [Coriobacteriaceae bacterium]
MDTAEAEDKPKPPRAAARRPVWPATPTRCWSDLDTPLTLESIARELCVSRSRLAATYKAERGRAWPRSCDCADRARPRASGRHGSPLSEVGRVVAIRARAPSPPPSPARSAAPRRLAQAAPPLRLPCSGIPSRPHKREGAPRGSFCHLSLPGLLARARLYFAEPWASWPQANLL